MEIDKLWKNKVSRRETLEDTRFLKQEDSSFESYNSNQTNFDMQSQLSRRGHEMTSIMNNPMNFSKERKNSIDQNTFHINDDDMGSLEGQSFAKSKPKRAEVMNRSCMDFKKRYRRILTKETENSERNFSKKKLLTSSMIISNFTDLPPASGHKEPVMAGPGIRHSTASQKSGRFHRSSFKRSPESSFLVSKKTLNPAQIPGDSFLKVNLSKIPSGTGKGDEKRRRARACRPSASSRSWTK